MSDAAGFVLDASALLAHLLAEPGGDVVRDSLAEQAAVMSAVNWAEMLSRLASAGADPDEGPTPGFRGGPRRRAQGPSR